MHYKDDNTFQRYLLMACVGEYSAIELMRPYGHEFELSGLGAGSYDIFKDVRLKAKRTADLRCRHCGRKLEVRAKSHLAIRMSHSTRRPFYDELAPEDWVGFVRVVDSGSAGNQTRLESFSRPSAIYVIRVSELTEKMALASYSEPKDARQGSERILTWPALLSPIDGTIASFRRDPSGVEVTTARGRSMILTPPAGSYLYNGIRPGHAVHARETLICGVAKTLSSGELKCPSRT